MHSASNTELTGGGSAAATSSGVTSQGNTGSADAGSASLGSASSAPATAGSRVAGPSDTPSIWLTPPARQVHFITWQVSDQSRQENAAVACLQFAANEWEDAYTKKHGFSVLTELVGCTEMTGLLKAALGRQMVKRLGTCLPRLENAPGAEENGKPQVWDADEMRETAGKAPANIILMTSHEGRLPARPGGGNKGKIVGRGPEMVDPAFSSRCPPQHLRAIVHVNGGRVQAVGDTGADISLISAQVLPSGTSLRPWTPQDGHVFGVAYQDVTLLGRVVVDLRMGPLRKRVPILVVLGVAFDVILGVDFLCDHDIAIQFLRLHLILQGHGDAVYPLMGHSPQFKHVGVLSHDMALYPHGRALARLANMGLSNADYYVSRQWYRSLGLYVPDQTVKTYLGLCTYSDSLLYLPAGWPLGRVTPVCRIATHKGRLGTFEDTGVKCLALAAGISSVCVVTVIQARQFASQ